MRFTLAIFTLLSSSMFSVAQVELIVPIGHSRRITEVQQSANQQWLASTDGSDVVKIWNYTNELETYHFSTEKPVTSISYAPKGPMLYVADLSGKVYQLNEKAQNLLTINTNSSSPWIKALGSDSLVVVADNLVSLWIKGKQDQTLKSKIGQINTASVDKKILYIGGAGGKLETIDLNKMESLGLAEVSEDDLISISSYPEGALIGTQQGQLLTYNPVSKSTKSTNAFSLRTYDIAYNKQLNQIIACGRDSKQNIKSFDLNLQEQPLPFSWSENMESEAFQFGLRVVNTNTDSTLLLANYENQILEYDFKNKRWNKTFKGQAASIYDLAVDRTGHQLAIASNHGVIKVLDLTGASSDVVFEASPSGSRAVDFHPVNPVLASYGLDEQIRVTNLINQKELFTLKAKGEYSTTPVTFDPTGKYVLRKSSDEDFDFYNFSTNKPNNLKVKDGKDYVFTPDGRKLIFHTSKGLTAFDPIGLTKLTELPLENIQHLSISNNGQLGVLLRDDQTVKIYDASNMKMQSTISLEASADKLYWTPDATTLIGIRNSVKRGEGAPDFSIKLYNAMTGQLKKTLSGHSGFTFDVEFVNGKMLTCAVDGVINIWEVTDKSTEPKGMVIPLTNDQYVVTTPSGLFDATAKAMDQLHYVKEGELINLEQIKDSYYEPKLLSKLLELNTEPIRSSESLAGVGLYPEMTLEHPLKNDGKLGIHLGNKGGGIGRVIILINGKEVSSDVRAASSTPDASSLEIDYDITDHPFLYNDKVSKITIKAYNTDGTLSTEEKSLYVFGEQKTLEAPNLYAIIAGSSDYEGEALDLKYAAKDAADLAHALELSASKYLGTENTNITLLTTDKDKSEWPTKQNIQKAFEEYTSKAKASDILLVYLSGHGVNHTGDQSDFYYLTCTAGSGDMNNTVLRDQTAISSSEFTEYIKAVPALKQILIIDACHSGRLASSLASSRSAMSSTQIRALERMKDRTGLFVLAGSAADAVSYETTLYGQGLLTYSLLFGMKGAALRDNEFIDVLDLFQFAANKVPELAEEIGGIQKPEIRVPEDGKSFDIGRLNSADRDAIELAAPKPVYVHSRFQDESAIFDRLDLSDMVDQQLIEWSKMDDASIAFVDDKDFSGATIINGRYEEVDGLLKATITFVQKGTITKKVELEAVNAALLSEAILAELPVY
ncbi:caspase family protein [Marinoscillum sp.]|uniref:caspase family protein n=1 Tax=Marinoscillum sp. TaxID=2024838 RepID=UPI003BAB0C92